MQDDLDDDGDERQIAKSTRLMEWRIADCKTTTSPPIFPSNFSETAVLPFLICSRSE
ncbi:hypothetical protein JCM9140_4424 [Halalkalibacter wakoensis JCM 9140]|uniref:Uncharacterized protein n=1 Tax=Halalkalibacter wakoensis JCM 9140 TaxID=1236970 RepID=W4Q9Z3_9BACI|nr:hypothetical protein JCM9140_4424 [Halalkalibacter wakoensis JCM 9140]